MGIKGLQKFIDATSEKSGENLRYGIPLDEFAGHRVTVDAMNWIYKHLYISISHVVGTTNLLVEEPNRDEVMKHLRYLFLIFIRQYTKCRVIPVMVFDGKAPPEKDRVRDERKRSRDKIATKLTELKENIKGLNDFFDIPDGTMAELKRLTQNNMHIGREEVEDFRGFVDAIGAPWLMATGEAEPLCSMLNIEYQASAVLSTDTDNLVYGCHVLITEVNTYNDGVPVYSAMNSADVVEELGFTHEEFVDFCIMCGCDYNVNIRGIGPAGSHKLIKEFKSIEGLPDKYKTDCLKHEVCRVFFRYTPSKSLIESGHMDYDQKKVRAMRSILSSYGLDDSMSVVAELCQKCPTVDYDYIYNPKSKEVFKIALKK